MSFLVAQMVKNPPAMRDTWVRSLGWEDPPGEGHGNPLQYSCPENPMDRGAWQSTVHGGHEDLDMTERLSTHILYFLVQTYLSAWSFQVFLFHV